MKIGLTGGTGFIGQHLLKDYADRHTFVAATSRENTGVFISILISNMSFPIIQLHLLCRFRGM